MVAGLHAFCQFGGGVAMSPASWVSATRMECVTPPMTSGSSTVNLLAMVSGNAVLASRAFEFQATAAILSTTPSSGPAAGASLVMLIGSHFSARAAAFSYLRCRFNLTATVARFVNDTVVICTSPAYVGDVGPARLSSLVPLEMSNNVVDFTASGMRFEYRNAVQLMTLTPASGPSGGGSLVTVRGEHLMGNVILCRFGTTDVAGSFVSMGVVQCVSPAHDRRRSSSTNLRVDVSVSTNGASFSESSILFTYHVAIEIGKLDPAQGPQQGRTLVAIHGRGFMQTSSLRCNFGSAVVDAVFVSDTVVNCTAPAQSAGAVALEVSNNAIDFSRSGVNFNYVSVVSVLLLSPPIGPRLGGSIVSVVGTGMPPGSACRFGGLAAVAATLISAGELLCVSPAQPVGRYPLEVTGNSQDFTFDGVVFRYVDRPVVTRAVPMLGPLEGGTLVQLQGSGFLQVAGLACRFGSRGLPVPARWLSGTQLECRSRARGVAGNVTVEVSMNNQDFSASGVRFEYLGNAAVGVLRPAQGPVGGGTLVEVQGSAFWERSASLGLLYCRFGPLGLSRAQRISNDAIECVAPAHAAGEVAVEVSLNGVDFTSSGVTYAYLGPTIQAVHPALGPEQGGTVVTVIADALPSAQLVYCLFGALPSAAFVYSSTQLVCVAPLAPPGDASLRLAYSSTADSEVEIESALNDKTKDVLSSRATFQYLPTALVTALEPSVAPVFGGTVVTVRGLHFASHTHGGLPSTPISSHLSVSPVASSAAQLLCRFGDVQVPAELINSTALRCVSPLHAATLLAVEVSFNGLDFTGSGVLFDVAAFSITGVSPSHGPVAGGTPLAVHLDSLPQGVPLFCRFGTAAFTQLVAAVPTPNGTVVQVCDPSPVSRISPFPLTFDRLDRAVSNPFAPRRRRRLQPPRH